MTDAIDTHGDTREQLSTDEAVQRSGLSRSQITNLLRQGKLEGQNFGGRYWIVYADSLERYLTSPRKSGPKGPRTVSTTTNAGSDTSRNKTDTSKKTS